MQQERGESNSEGEDRKQPKDQRLTRAMQGGSENQQLLQQPQKCPRCESLNTKFCYYNNYSLSQPRYFCKTCRRYWTQGGTLRNVPVGGGCRKGKRTKTSSDTATATATAEPSRPQPPPPPPPSSLSRNKELPASSSATGTAVAPASSIAASMGPGSYYPSGGFLSSLAAIQTQSFNPLQLSNNSNHNFGGSSNLGVQLQGFSTVVPSFGSASQQIEQPQVYQMGNIREKSADTMYHQNPSDHHHHHHQESLIDQLRRPGSSAQHEASWHHLGFISTDNNNNNNNNHNPNGGVPADDDTGLWGGSSSTNNTNTNNAAASVSGSFNPNDHRWPGYGPPP